MQSNLSLYVFAAKQQQQQQQQLELLKKCWNLQKKTFWSKLKTCLTLTSEHVYEFGATKEDTSFEKVLKIWVNTSAYPSIQWCPFTRLDINVIANLQTEKEQNKKWQLWFIFMQQFYWTYTHQSKFWSTFPQAIKGSKGGIQKPLVTWQEEEQEIFSIHVHML